MSESATQTAGNGDSGMRIHPPLLAGGLLIATLVLHLLADHHHYRHPVQVHHLVGLLTAMAGAWCGAFAAGVFTGAGTTFNPYGEPARLINTAPYTLTRNPMYLGLTAILLGFAIFFWSPLMLLAPIVFFLVIDRMVIPREEESLHRIFGAAYEDYRRRVRRWL